MMAFLSFLPILLIFLVILSVLVAAHEYGHYIFARMFGMGVEEFAIGFGRKPLWIWMRRHYTVPVRPGQDPSLKGGSGTLEKTSLVAVAQNAAIKLEGALPPDANAVELVDTQDGPALKETTDFTVRPWPFGGFVRIKGMVPEEDGSEVRIPGGFYSKPPWQRFLVLLAGPLFSVLAGVIVLTGVYMIKGVPTEKPYLGDLAPGKPAILAGLRKGDLIEAINGQRVKVYVDILRLVKASDGKALAFLVKRGEQERSILVQPAHLTEAEIAGQKNTNPNATRRWIVGALPLVAPLGFGPALVEASLVPYRTVAGLVGVVAKRPSELSENVGGVISMLSVTRAVVEEGFLPVLEFAALLSMSVGIFNLLPVPPLDGGQMLMAVAEMLRGGRRLSMQVQGIVTAAGLAIVVLLTVTVFFIDIRRLTHPAPPDKPSVGQSAPPNK